MQVRNKANTYKATMARYIQHEHEQEDHERYQAVYKQHNRDRCSPFSHIPIICISHLTCHSPEQQQQTWSKTHQGSLFVVSLVEFDAKGYSLLSSKVRLRLAPAKGL